MLAGFCRRRGHRAGVYRKRPRVPTGVPTECLLVYLQASLLVSLLAPRPDIRPGRRSGRERSRTSRALLTMSAVRLSLLRYFEAPVTLTGQTLLGTGSGHCYAR